MPHVSLRSLSRAALTLAVTLIAIGPAQSCRSQEVTFDQQLSGRVVAWLQIPDISLLQDRAAASNWGRLCSDPALAGFRDSTLAWLKDSVAGANGLPAGLTFDELLSVPSGEISIALMMSDSGQLPLAACIDVSKRTEQAEQLLAAAKTSLEASQWTASLPQHAGTTITRLVAPEQLNGAADELCYCLRDGRLVLTSSLAAVQQILDRWDGGATDSFARNPVWQQIRSQIGPQASPVVWWYFDPVGLTTSLAADRPVNDPTAVVLKKSLTEYGLASFKGLGGSIDLATPEFDAISHTIGIVPEPQGALLLMRLPAAKLQLPAWAPASASGCMVLNWDLKTAWSALLEVTSGFMPEGQLTGAIDGLATMANGPKIHLRNDLIEALTGELVLIQKRHAANDAADSSPSDRDAVLLAARVQDAARAQTLLQQLIDAPAVGAGTRTVASHRVAIVTNRRGRSLHLAVAHDCLLVSSNAGLLDEVLSAEADSATAGFRNTPEAAALLRHVPDSVSSVGVQHPAGQVRSLYQMLKDSQLLSPDVSQLPEFDVISRYFQPTAAYSRPIDGGFEYVSFRLPLADAAQ